MFQLGTPSGLSIRPVSCPESCKQEPECICIREPVGIQRLVRLGGFVVGARVKRTLNPHGVPSSNFKGDGNLVVTTQPTSPKRLFQCLRLRPTLFHLMCLISSHPPTRRSEGVSRERGLADSRLPFSPPMLSSRQDAAKRLRYCVTDRDDHSRIRPSQYKTASRSPPSHSNVVNYTDCIR